MKMHTCTRSSKQRGRKHGRPRSQPRTLQPPPVPQLLLPPPPLLKPLRSLQRVPQRLHRPHLPRRIPRWWRACMRTGSPVCTSSRSSRRITSSRTVAKSSYSTVNSSSNTRSTPWCTTTSVSPRVAAARWLAACSGCTRAECASWRAQLTLCMLLRLSTVLCVRLCACVGQLEEKVRGSAVGV